MKKCVAVFRSRTQVMNFCEHTKKKGGICKLIPTPKEAKTGCGISCEIPISQIGLSKEIILFYSLNAFYGFFIIEKEGNRASIRKI